MLYIYLFIYYSPADIIYLIVSNDNYYCIIYTIAISYGFIDGYYPFIIEVDNNTESLFIYCDCDCDCEEDSTVDVVVAIETCLINSVSSLFSLV